MKELQLDIVSPEKVVFSGEVDKVTLPGVAGAFTILPRHAPIVSTLMQGTVVYATGGEEHSLEVQGGFVEMNGNRVSVCVEVTPGPDGV